MLLTICAAAPAANAGPGACTTAGTTATCQGDQSAGITSGADFLSPPVTTLNVNGLSADIGPAAGVNGINFINTVGSNLTVDSDTGAFAINVGSAVGIFAASFSPGASGDIRVVSAGTITTGDFGIGIAGRTETIGTAGKIEITSSSNITSGLAGVGIFGRSFSPIVESGAVTITSTGDLSIGDFGRAILAESEAGTTAGAITIGSSGSVTVGAFGFGIRGESRSATDAGSVSITSTGAIKVGDGSFGIFAQNTSTGAGSAESVTVESSADITADGANSVGILAASTATTAGNIEVSVLAGTIIGGTGAGSAVDIVDGATNTLTNFGTLTTVLGTGGVTVRGSTGDETVVNAGTITGSIDLGAGANAFNNAASGLFNTGTVVTLGAGNLFTNDGVLAPGAAGSLMTTALTGDLAQSGSGIYYVDVDVAGGASDVLNVSGTATLAGVVLAQVQNPTLLAQQFTILSATGGTTNSGLGLIASPALNAELLYPNANDVVLGIAIDFSTIGLNRNQTSIGDNLNAVLAAGSGSLGPALDALLNGVFTLADYKSALDQLSPEIYGITQTTTLYASLDFADNLMSCRVNGTDTASIAREGQCLWAGAKARFLDGDRTSEQIGFDETGGMFAAGAQVALDSAWRLGFGIGYQTSALQTDTGAESEGDLVLGGIAVKYSSGPLLLAGTVSGGRGWYDTTRTMNFGGFAGMAESDHQVDVLAGRLHASYVFGAPGLYFKPLVDLNLTQVDLGSVRETGGNGAALIVAGSSETVFSASPALEIGTEWWLSNGTLLRPFVRAGASWYDGGDFTLSGAFAGAPAGVSPFTIRTAFDDVQADVSAGIDAISKDDAALRFSYDGHYGDQIEIHSIGLKGSARF